MRKTSLGDQMSVSYAVIGNDGRVIAQNKRAEFVLNEEEATEIQQIYDLAASKLEEN